MHSRWKLSTLPYPPAPHSFPSQALIPPLPPPLSRLSNPWFPFAWVLILTPVPTLSYPSPPSCPMPLLTQTLPFISCPCSSFRLFCISDIYLILWLMFLSSMPIQCQCYFNLFHWTYPQIKCFRLCLNVTTHCQVCRYLELKFITINPSFLPNNNKKPVLLVSLC